MMLTHNSDHPNSAVTSNVVLPGTVPEPPSSSEECDQTLFNFTDAILSRLKKRDAYILEVLEGSFPQEKLKNGSVASVSEDVKSKFLSESEAIYLELRP